VQILSRKIATQDPQCCCPPQAATSAAGAFDADSSGSDATAE